MRVEPLNEAILKRAARGLSRQRSDRFYNLSASSLLEDEVDDVETAQLEPERRSLD